MDHMASSDTPDSRLDIEENPTSASFMPKKSTDQLEGAEETSAFDHVEDPSHQKSKRPHTLTEKGIEYQRSLKEKDFQRTFRKLREKLHELDMEWIDISDPDVLRKKRSDIEEYRLSLAKTQSEYVPLLLEKESRDVVEAATYLTKQVVELRMRIGERIFQLEKEELRSRNSRRSSYSKRTGDTRASRGSTSSQISLLKMKALTELAKKEVEMKYAKIETEKKMEMERKKHEIEELQRLKSYESAKAEANAVARLEEEEKNPDLKDLQEFQMNEHTKEELVSDYISSLPELSSLIDKTPQEEGNSQINAPVRVKQNLVRPPPLHINSDQPHYTPFDKPTIPCGPALMETQQRGIAEAIAEGMEAARLPTPHLTIFSGNPLDWPTWKVSFETVIEKRTMNSNEKILYLLQYLSGAPKKIVEGYQFLKTADAYSEAKKTLEKRFGHPSVVAEAFRKRLENWPKIHPKDGFALREFADFLKTCELAMQTVEDLETLNKQHDNKQLLKVLPNWAHPKWGVRVRDYQTKHGDNKFPPFAEFVKFVSEIAEVQCLPVLTNLDTSFSAREDKNRGFRRRNGSRRNQEANSLATGAKEKLPSHLECGKNGKKRACHWCGNTAHEIETCQEFVKKPINERTQFIIRKGLCLRCLTHGHMAKEKKCERVPSCAKCKQKHPTCLHDDSRTSTNVTSGADKVAPNTSTNCINAVGAENLQCDEEAAVKCTSVCSVEGQQSGQDQSLIIPVWVSSSKNPQNDVLTYALIDSQSNATFITEKLEQHLEVDSVTSHLRLSTMHQENEIVQCKKVQGLVVMDLKRQVRIPLPKVYTREAIPYKPHQIPKPEVAMQWDHLNCIAEELMPYREDVQVGMLIGTNCPKAIKPRAVIPGGDNDPYGIKTDLGWGIVGRVCKSLPDEDFEELSESWVNKIVINEDATFAVESRAKEIISPAHVKEMFERDFHERAEQKNMSALSVEDRTFLEILDKGICQREDGHYEMPLPLRSQDVMLPNNRSQALRRLSQLKARFRRDAKYYRDYVEFMEEMIKGCAEKAPPRGETGIKIGDGKINYVPHHGVYHPRKPGQIRVVFDCSAQYKGTSLNKNLLQGPDLTNNLMGVLCRFRQEAVALTCDVQGMFHQFFVDEADRDLLRFFWWSHGDLKNEADEYRMKVHLFGAASSPGCANFAFKRAADDGEKEFGSEAADFMRKDFYVDDGLKSVKCVDTAINLIKNCQAMCAKAGLRLHKFSSNKKEVIQAVPPEDRAKGLQELDLTRDPLPVERTLGIMWCAETDSFQFRIVIQDRPLTRRGILSTVSSVYDPLGLVAPLILLGKQILQDLCRENADWDDPIGDQLRPRWEQWRNELRLLEGLKIPRCYKPEEFGDPKVVELHHFSDASQAGYGQCSYLRLLNESDQAHCSLVMGKSRVTPLKSVTIPRLELTAAVVSVRVSQWLGHELDYQDVTEFFWTDSKVVMGYINNVTRRFHVFVANRVQQIHEHTQARQWQYIDTRSNPADAASRGLTAKQLLDDNYRWFKGPHFLWNPGAYQAETENTPEPLDPNDPEVKVSTLATQSEESFPNHFETARLDRVSSWFKVRRAVAVCLRFKCLLKERRVQKPTEAQSSKSVEDSASSYQPVKMEEIGHAEMTIIRCLQHEHFKEEIKTLSMLQMNGEFTDRRRAKQRNLNLKKCSSLYRLDPYLDANDILRVGGRLRRANMPEFSKHPVILPRRSHITDLILQYCHQATKHQGSGMTHNEVRQRGYWIIGGTSVVANLVSKCVICRKLRAPLVQQKLADLPEDRVEPAPPFTYSAVDYFGPFVLREGRKEIKRYGVLFTCMASRAIHIETANTLETDSFINALRRFQAERGPIRQLRSDRGTNFVGAQRELQEALSEMDEDKIRNTLLEENCEWVSFKMNPPSASHMGGSWERQIRTVRSVLGSLLEEAGHQLDDESFRTLLKEVQAVVNSRPLALNDMSSPDSPDPLTPNHLLTMKSKVLMPPPGVFLREDLYLRRRWRRVQHLANVFWDRWRKEFLQTLQLRKKWIKPQRNMAVNDVVMVKDENVPRNAWRLARVEEVFSSHDGLVRKVKLAMATRTLDKQGRRTNEVQYLDRPVHKLVLIQEADREFPDEEPNCGNKH